MSSVVFDASAVLAIVRKESGSDVAAAQIDGALMSAVNYSEVLKKSIELGGSSTVASDLMQRAQITVVPFDEMQAVTAANLFATTRDLGLSFADRACLSLGVLYEAKVVTADEDMSLAELPIKVALIRQKTKHKAKLQ